MHANITVPLSRVILGRDMTQYTYLGRVGYIGQSSITGHHGTHIGEGK